MHGAKEPRVVFKDVSSAPEAPKADEPSRKSRRLYIKLSDVEAYGYTEGCPKCDHDLKYGFGRTTKGHSDKCRARITAELAKTPAGRERIAAAIGRLEQYVSEYIEKHDQQVPAQGEQDGMRSTPIVENENPNPQFLPM